MKPIGNGLVEITGEKQSMDNGWFCMDLMLFLCGEEDKSWEHQHGIFLRAKNGDCPYKDKCPRYARTMEKYGRQPTKLKLFEI